MRTVKFASLVIAASAVLFACKPKEEAPATEVSAERASLDRGRGPSGELGFIR